MDGAKLAEALNQAGDGFARAMDLSFTFASADRIELEWTVARKHLQPYGLVHGGVHCGVIETACSVGAALSVGSREQGAGAVGLENHTSFVRGVREGAKLRAVATPLTRGRTTQLWQAQIRDEAGALVAQGTVRLLCVKPGQV